MRTSFHTDVAPFAHRLVGPEVINVLVAYLSLVGLAAELGYGKPAPGPMRRWVISVASTPVVSRINARILPPIDRLTLRLTGGRSTVTSLMTGLPVLWLTTTGARSGLSRTVPLLGFPVGDGIGLIGTRFGHRATPGWVHNLEASERASLSHQGVEVPVRARPARIDEAEEVWARATASYPGYAKYTERAAHRVIRVFVLEAPGTD